jgi:two-component system invasion response regulator UvrY
VSESRRSNAGTPREADELSPVRVLTVDDHATFRAAARALVAATPGFELAGEVTTGEDGVAATAMLSPDLVLMDVKLPDMDGYEATRRITPIRNDVVVVLISAAEEELQGDAPAHCGAAAFIRKQDLRPDVLRRVWATHGGHR